MPLQRQLAESALQLVIVDGPRNPQHLITAALGHPIPPPNLSAAWMAKHLTGKSSWRSTVDLEAAGGYSAGGSSLLT
jgi:hypothetical protein